MDIDIDLVSSFVPENYFKKVVHASMIKDGEIEQHQAGVYFQNMPTDPVTGLAAIPFREAESYGFTKIDMIHLTLLNSFESKEQLTELSRKEPNWSLLEDRKFVEKLFQIGGKFEIVYKMKPKSILELADVLCMIRPNKLKMNLVDKYIRNKQIARKELYIKRDGSDFRKSHALAYALLIVAQMNLLEKEYTYDPFA